jgi:glycosyltransferase involved in cell wall biosynthesis
MLVSCLMPTRDRRPYIPLAIRSFQNQTHQEKELLILDDGEDTILDLVPPDPRIHYLRNDCPPWTLGHKLNALAKTALGEILCNWDDDDWAAPGRIAYQLAHLTATEKALTGFNNFHYWDTTANQAYLWKHPARTFKPPGSTQMYARAWALAHPMRDMTLPVDLHFATEAHTHGQVTEQPGIGYLVVRYHQACCWKATMRNRGYPRVPTTDLPQQFFADLKEA